MEFNVTDALGWIELDEGGRVRFGGTSLPREWGFAWVSVGTRVEVRGTKPGYRGVPKAVAVVPLVTPEDSEGLVDGALATSRPIQLFVAFAPVDDAFARCLENHLAALESRGVVRTWSERRLDPGADREVEIGARLDEADIVLLLISADFLASPACMRLAERALELAHSAPRPAEIIPILVRAADWEITSLACFQGLPSNRAPVASWPNHDDAWVDVVKGIREVVKRLARSRQRASEPPGTAADPAPQEGRAKPVREQPRREPVYTQESPGRLTPMEVDLLVEYLKDAWPEALSLTLHVDEGYGISGLDDRLFVGRARIYEELARRKLIEEATERRSKRWCALYYPGATPSHSFLFQAVLYFDELFVIHPGSTLSRQQRVFQRFGEPGCSQDDQKFLDRLSVFDQAVLPLKEALVLHCVPPQMHRHPDFVRLLTSDLDDPGFVSLASATTHEPVFIAAKKMESLLPLIGEGGDVDSIRRDLHRRAGYGRSGDRRGELFPGDSFYGVKMVTPVLASSILLNHAFLTAERYGLIPVTDDPGMARLLQRKLARISARKEFVDFRRELQIKAGSLAIRAVEEYLPSFRFESFEHVLEARERLSEHLLSFRSAMLSLAAEIDESPYDQLFPKRVEHVLSVRIRPAVEALRREIQRSQDSFVVKFLRNVQVGSIPIVGLVLAGLPPSAVIAMGAGVLTAEAAIETYRDVKAIRRNGFSLLLGDACNP
ncbi:toll/interleukin-1 receptor domain-containing protein [Sorangium sp. So ce128]|uniref:toll/interleukin-1 receptor domain-containing protein n=1 Tax=Sorangium sp. So ce128 TaxID=3133281 RepID=UPI003F6052E5